MLEENYFGTFNVKRGHVIDISIDAMFTYLTVRAVHINLAYSECNVNLQYFQEKCNQKLKATRWLISLIYLYIFLLLIFFYNLC